MNFIGHLYVALWSSEEPTLLLGSMLPDFAGMAGVRLSQIGDQTLARGVRLHHRTDEAFHAVPTFSALVQSTVARLSELGVARGPARAVGHVGVEMFIDGELVRRARVGDAYLSALAAFSCIDPESLGRLAHPALLALLERLTRHGIPYDYERPEAVTARLSSVLERRPRLALDARSQEIVGSIMPDLKARVAKQLPALLDELARSPSDPSYSETITG